MPSHWNEYHRRWARLTPPLRPDAEVTCGFEKILAGRDARVLLLGVTPELAHIGEDLCALDRSAAMITHIWPGDTAWRRARKGDWLALPFGAEAFTAIIGDGSLSALSWPHDYRVFFAQAARVLEKAGVVAIRLFATPDETETTDMLKRNAQAGHCKSFHAFKWQLAMAMVAEARDPNIAVAVICNGFNAMFPDRGELAAVTGWSRQDIDTIDVYANSPDVYSFPTLRELRSTIPDTFENVRAVACGAYPLAERCPLLAMDRS